MAELVTGTKRVAARPRSRSGGGRNMRKYGHLWFVAPGFIFFVGFMIYPAIFAVYVSMTGWTGLGNDFPFVGFDNFVQALTTWPLYRAAMNNGIMFISILLFQHTVGLFIAVQLNAKPRFMEFYRAILFMPVIISLVATGFIWTLMLSPHIGFINPVLKSIGLGFLAKNWLSDPNLALGTVIFVSCWNALGWSIIIYLAGLQNIPEELTQAASVDGASAWQVFRRVTFPLLWPSFSSLTILTFIGSFRAFDIVYVLTGPIGSPAYRTDILGTLIYRTAFGGTGQTSVDIRMSLGIAMALIVFVVMLIVAAVLIRVLRSREVDA